jgi:hypothetical protein
MSFLNEAYVGIDVAKLRNAIAIAEAGREGEIRYLGEVDASPESMKRLVVKFGSKYARLHFCYEAGPTGYGLHRLITDLGHSCTVVAPSLIPRKASDRVKTNRRDATALARLLRAGELSSVWVPDPAHEAIVDALQALRGIDLVVAVSFVVEIGDIRRFASPRQLMGYLGLVPEERSTGETVRRGSITKMGNPRIRQLLVESAWTYRFPPRIGAKKLQKLDRVSPKIREIAWKAQSRLSARFRAFSARGKKTTVTCTAVARERPPSYSRSPIMQARAVLLGFAEMMIAAERVAMKDIVSNRKSVAEAFRHLFVDVFGAPSGDEVARSLNGFVYVNEKGRKTIRDASGLSMIFWRTPSPVTSDIGSAT